MSAKWTAIESAKRQSFRSAYRAALYNSEFTTIRTTVHSTEQPTFGCAQFTAFLATFQPAHQPHLTADSLSNCAAFFTTNFIVEGVECRYDCVKHVHVRFCAGWYCGILA